MNRRRGLLLTAGLWATISPSYSQEDCCPGKCCPSGIIVPFPPGGTVDTIARLLANELQQRWGSPVTVENVGGAGGLIGATRVATAAPDGKTLLITNESLLTNAALFPQQGRSALEGLTAITQITAVPYVLVVPAQSPYRTLQELVSDVRRNPGKVNMASSGNGSTSHIAGATFLLAAKLDAPHIPYRGTGPALNDLVAGQVSFGVFDVPSVQSEITSGKLRALAVSGAGASPAIRGTPSFAQNGIDTQSLSSWTGLFAPKGLQPSAVRRVASDVDSVLRQANLKELLTTRGFDPNPLAPAEFSAKIQRDLQVRSATISTLRISRD